MTDAGRIRIVRLSLFCASLVAAWLLSPGLTHWLLIGPLFFFPNCLCCPSVDCETCQDGTAASQYQVIIAGMFNGVPAVSCPCTDLNGTYVLDFVADFPPCHWAYLFDDPGQEVECEDAGLGFFVTWYASGLFLSVSPGSWPSIGLGQSLEFDCSGCPNGPRTTIWQDTFADEDTCAWSSDSITFRANPVSTQVIGPAMCRSDGTAAVITAL